jgi:hypothetical protein
MREFINIIQTLSEAAVGMSPGEITKYEARFEKFIEKIKSKAPFTTVDGTEVTIDPREAKRFIDLYSSRLFKGAVKARTTDGQEIPLSKLAKTIEFGGAAVDAGQDASTAGKEALLVKPKTIGITDKDIPAHDLYEIIQTNSVLNSTEYGKVIIQLAEYIVAGEYIVLPEEYQGKEKEKVRKAIIDYAGEYLGVLALLYNRSRFPRKEQFNKWLGGSTDDLILNFPGNSTTNLADSYATVTSGINNRTLNISSKGTGGGAAPAISGLTIPDELARNPAFKNAIRFVEICKASDKAGGPSTITSAFKAMDLIFEVNPKALPKKWHKFLPFNTKNTNLVQMSIDSLTNFKNKKPSLLPDKYVDLFIDIESKGSASDGGKLIYSIKKTVAEAMNNDAIPEFKAVVLQLLEMNFIQQYCDYSSGQITFATQWPAKLDGEVSVENKSSTGDPTAGGFSFKLGRTDSSVSSEHGDTSVVGGEIDNTPDIATIATDVVNPKRKDEPEAPAGVGRERRIS